MDLPTGISQNRASLGELRKTPNARLRQYSTVKTVLAEPTKTILADRSKGVRSATAQIGGNEGNFRGDLSFSGDIIKGARELTIAGLSDSKFDTILKPTQLKPAKEATILGFDTEFGPDGALLSAQLAALNSDGKPVSRVFYVRDLTKESLLGFVKGFCDENGIELCDNIVLVAHFASAEISHITGFLEHFNLRTYNRATEGSTEVEYVDPSDRENMYVAGETKAEKYKLRIVDLFGFYVLGLDDVGKMYGFEKLSLEKFWKSNMDRFLLEHPEKFEAYARRDAEIAVVAYTKMRQFYVSNYGLDVLRYKTTPGLAMAIFRSQYLTEPVAPFEQHPEPYHYKNKKGEWKLGFRNRTFLCEDWRAPRRGAMLAYWGGRNESYGRGLLKEALELFDVDSLYPSAAALQPLPNAHTQWIVFNSTDQVASLEGYAHVEFQFSLECTYPCLPVPSEMSDRIYFPLKGVSSCTLAEVREAIRLGAKIAHIEGVGFNPGPSERDHPARRYALDFMEKKRRTEGAEKTTNKLLLNALYGKFVETQKDAELGQVLALIKRGTITAEQAPQVYKQKKSPFRRTPKDVGTGWWIEAAALILGKARALMSAFITKGALMGITDSVLLPGGTDIECPALDELRSVGSDLKSVYKADTFWTLRTRVYVLWEGGQVVKFARHAFPLADSSFLGWVSQSVRRGEAIPLVTRKTHLVSLKEAVQKGKQFGSAEIKQSRPKLDWDQKRVETKRVNPFAEWTFYPPQPIVPETMRGRGRPRNPAT
jgi:hypothetical protein